MTEKKYGKVMQEEKKVGNHGPWKYAGRGLGVVLGSSRKA